MLDEAELKAVGWHGQIHEMGMCSCPCLDALVKVSKAIAEEREMLRKMGAVSPEALAAVIGSHVHDDDAP